jgi:hypothetical protein
MKKDGASDAEITDELALIRAQQAFVRHTRGKSKEAMELYEEVLKAKSVVHIPFFGPTCLADFTSLLLIIAPLMPPYLLFATITSLRSTKIKTNSTRSTV